MPEEIGNEIKKALNKSYLERLKTNTNSFNQ